MANFVQSTCRTDRLCGSAASEEDAWDVSAYVLSHPRPQKANLNKDYPNLLAKPVDTPYPPYADGFSEEQHKVGPFAPIRAAIEKLKTEK